MWYKFAVHTCIHVASNLIWNTGQWTGKKHWVGAASNLKMDLKNSKWTKFHSRPLQHLSVDRSTDWPIDWSPSITVNHARLWLTMLNHSCLAFDALCLINQPFSFDLGRSIDRSWLTTVDLQWWSTMRGQSQWINQPSAARMAYSPKFGVNMLLKVLRNKIYVCLELLKMNVTGY